VRPADYLSIASGISRRRKRLAIMTCAVACAIVLPTAHYLSKGPTSFQSMATILFEPSLEAGHTHFGPRSFAVQLAILQSRSLAERVLDALPPAVLAELRERPAGVWGWVLVSLTASERLVGVGGPTESARENELRELQSRARFHPKGEGVVVITTWGRSRESAMSLAGSYVDVLSSRTRAFTADDSRLTREFLERQVSDLSKTLRASEARFQAFVAASGGAKIAERSHAAVQQLSEAEARLGEAEVNRKMAEARLENLRRRLPATSQESSRGNSGPWGSAVSVESIRRHLTHLEAALEELRAKHGDDSPKLDLLNERIAERRRALLEMSSPSEPMVSVLRPGAGSEFPDSVQALETTIRALKLQEEGLGRRARAVRETLAGLSASEVKYATLARDLEVAQRLYSVLVEKLTAARIREDGGTVIKVIEPPTPAVPVANMRRVAILGLALMLVMGATVGIPLVAELRTRRIDTPEDLSRVIGTPPLALIPDLRGNGHVREKQFILAEGFRSLRVEVEMSRRSRRLRSLLVTSALPQEGKSTAVVNLARVFREAGATVIIADGDFLRPTLHLKLDIPPTPSLADVMSGTHPLEAALVDIGTGIQAIAPRPAPTPASRGLMTRHRLQPLVAALTTKADIVIFDSAPLLSIRETALLASVVDSVVLVVNAGGPSWEDVTRTKALLDATGAITLGTVLNQVPVATFWRQYRHYYEPYWSTDDVAPNASMRSAKDRRTRA
jgi:polysaccharide biosynthesis transport protein